MHEMVLGVEQNCVIVGQPDEAPPLEWEPIHRDGLGEGVLGEAGERVSGAVRRAEIGHRYPDLVRALDDLPPCPKSPDEARVEDLVTRDDGSQRALECLDVEVTFEVDERLELVRAHAGGQFGRDARLRLRCRHGEPARPQSPPSTRRRRPRRLAGTLRLNTACQTAHGPRAKTASRGSSMPSRSRIAIVTRTARSESPPSSTKSSSRRHRPLNASAQIAASRALSGDAGGAKIDRASAGAGNAARSILPRDERGSASRRTNADGIMWAGSSFSECALDRRSRQRRLTPVTIARRTHAGARADTCVDARPLVCWTALRARRSSSRLAQARCEARILTQTIHARPMKSSHRIRKDRRSLPSVHARLVRGGIDRRRRTLRSAPEGSNTRERLGRHADIRHTHQRSGGRSRFSSSTSRFELARALSARSRTLTPGEMERAQYGRQQTVASVGP